MNLLNSGTRLPLPQPRFRLFPQPLPRPTSFFFRNSRVAVAYRKWKRRPHRTAPHPAAPRHSHRGHSIHLSLAARPLFFSRYPSYRCKPLSLSLSSSRVLSAWRISRNPNDVRAGSGFVFFVPGPPFSKRALKEKRT